jgi:hypothetical protein
MTLKKMPALYVASATHQSIGKTALCLGLALKFMEEGLNVGYFKPLGRHTASLEGKPADVDTILMKKLLGLEASTDLITPVIFEHQYLDQYSDAQLVNLSDRISEAYREVMKGKDLMILEALHELCRGASFNLSASELAKRLNSELLLVSSSHQDRVVDEIIFEFSCISRGGARCMGAVLNRIHSSMDERVRKLIVPTLEKKGIPTWGLIPENTSLTAPTVKELAEILGGKIICGEENMHKLVESYLVGAMTQESAIRYFRRAMRKAVITGGDRPDIALAALETDTSALILTGDLFPDARVCSSAKEKGTPIILVSYDTYTTIEKVRGVSGRIKVGDEKRISIAKELVSEHVDWRGLLKNLGLKL